MKRIYIKPETEVVACMTQQFFAASKSTEHGTVMGDDDVPVKPIDPYAEPDPGDE